MQFTRGAGLTELISFNKITYKNTYQIYRPLLDITKNQLQEYLDKNNIRYFIDITNFDEKYRRNYFRKNFSNELLEKFEEGIKRSFEYLQKDISSLNINHTSIYKEAQLEVFAKQEDDNLNIRVIDLNLKKRGILLSKAQRDEILKQKELVISHKFSISITEKYIFISPYENCTIDKKFKEKCRVSKIPKYNRAYIYKNNLLGIFDLIT